MMSEKPTGFLNRLRSFFRRLCPGQYETPTSFQWTIWLTIVPGTIFLLAGSLAQLPLPWSTLVLTFGSLLFSIGVVGALLNAVWWRAWTTQAILEIFSNRELIEKLHLDREEMQERFHAMIGATYGARLLSPSFKMSFDRNLLSRLAIPVRENFELIYDLELLDLETDEFKLGLAKLTRQVSYQLQNYSRRPRPPFDGGLVTSGFVDLPELIIEEWRRKCGSGDLTSSEAEKTLEDMNKTLGICTFPYLSIGGNALEEGKDYRFMLKYDGSKREPQIAFEVRLTEDAQKKYILRPDGKTRLSVVHLHEMIHNLISYDFSMCNQITEEATFHFQYNSSRFSGAMRYIMPPYWSQEERQIIAGGEGRLSLYVHTVLFPGHAVHISWKPLDLTLGLGTRTELTKKREPRQK